MKYKKEDLSTSTIPWVGDNNTDVRRKKRFRKHNKISPPICNISGNWIAVGHFEGTDFPYLAVFSQNGNIVNGNGISSTNPENSFTVTSGYLSGDVLVLKIGFTTDGFIGTEDITATVDCAARSMVGTFFIAALGITGSWTATQT